MNSKNDNRKGSGSNEVETFGGDYHKLESTFSLQPTPPKRPGAARKKTGTRKGKRKPPR